jgi:hypothetical protein
MPIEEMAGMIHACDGGGSWLLHLLRPNAHLGKESFQPRLLFRRSLTAIQESQNLKYRRQRGAEFIGGFSAASELDTFRYQPPQLLFGQSTKIR